MSRRKLVAANWKMNLTLEQGRTLLEQLTSGLPEAAGCDVVIAPPFTHIEMLVRIASGTPLLPAAQNCHYESSGAYTGEISVDMLKSAGVNFIITGHSERRQLFHEDNEIIRKKTSAILQGGLTPIFCCGESLDIREAGLQNTFVEGQLQDSLFHLSPEAFSRLIIAYEPIWAIGTGVNATAQQAQDMHQFIRHRVASVYGPSIADALRILYGGSIKAGNATELFGQPDVDGGLVGGASLDAEGFLSIIRAAC